MQDQNNPSMDENLETVEKIRQMKKRNPEWIKFFMMGFFMGRNGVNPISINDNEEPMIDLNSYNKSEKMSLKKRFLKYIQ